MSETRWRRRAGVRKVDAVGEGDRRRWERASAPFSLCGGLHLARPCLFTRLHSGTETSLRDDARAHARARARQHRQVTSTITLSAH
ncbi:unnamed protein product [Tetraodon nigroviridis]|uniref:(spotted green pufferfish) hypothetical protein n=1 Tax=Tetraodon nigroviridis TaxID=99883 RepID=Q4STT4_TETNG|nr:unnamed protein product [Tetraodon nigroviridis]